jgi:hypothetical protein
MNSPRLPKSVSITDIADRKGLQKEPKQPEGTRKIPEAELRARLAHDAVNSTVPVDNSHQLNEQPETQMELPIMDILLYDRNPRKSQNENYEAIKDSIRATKRLTSPLVVTRRPGEKKFMVGQGGNTRLAILQELFTETGDPAFARLVVTFTPWKSEFELLAGHMRENELRGDMCFWDKANAYADLRRLLEEEAGSKLSARAFEQELKDRGGLPVGKTMLSYFRFAVDNLRALGDARPALTGVKVYALQPAFNAHERLLLHFIQQDTAWPEIRDQVLKSTEQSWLATGELDPARIIEHLDQAVALKLGEGVEFIRTARDLCQRFQSEEVTGLVAQARLQMKPTLPSSPTGAGRKTDAGSAPIPPSSPEKSPRGEGAGKARSMVQKSEPELLAAAQEVATHFARLCQVADCLRLTETWPTGFYVEVPENDDPIDLVEDGVDRYHGWWMLAMLSGQLDDTWSTLMPEDSTWRQAQRQENGRDEYALQHYMDTILGMPIDPLTLGRRLSGDAVSVPIWMELVQRLRDLRAVAPRRFLEQGGAQ